MPYKDPKKRLPIERNRYAKKKLDPEWMEHRRAKGRRWYAANRERHLEKLRIQRAAQRKVGLCEICGHERKLCWDHDHATGLFRGWLCRYCNLVLGNARDSIIILGQAAAYLAASRGIASRS